MTAVIDRQQSYYGPGRHYQDHIDAILRSHPAVAKLLGAGTIVSHNTDWVMVMARGNRFAVDAKWDSHGSGNVTITPPAQYYLDFAERNSCEAALIIGGTLQHSRIFDVRWSVGWPEWPTQKIDKPWETYRIGSYIDDQYAIELYHWLNNWRIR